MLHQTADWAAMLTKMITTATNTALEELRNRIEAELTRRELAGREHTDERQMKEERPASVGTLRLEMVKCGKERCKTCGRGEGHGPYWYLYFRRNGKLTSRYIGKTIPDELKGRGA